MTRIERIRYEMLLRVRDFGGAHRAQFPESSAGGQAFANVAKAVGEIDAHGTAKLLAAQAGRRATAAARSAVRRWMLTIARTARDVVRTTPGVERTLRMPKRRSDVALLTSARAFLDEGALVADKLVLLGLSSTFLSEFRRTVDAFEDAMAGRRAGRASVAAGQAGIVSALALGMDAARTLDVVVANVLGNDPVLFAKWQRDRRLVNGKSKRTAVVVMPAEPSAGETAIDTSPVESSGDVPADPAPAPLALVSLDETHDALKKAS